MQDARQIHRAGTWSGAAEDFLLLAYEERHRRRFRLTTEGGRDVLLNLERATLLNHGDALELETGELIEVRAADEPLLEVRASSPHALLRLAWHLGNRHLPAVLEPERILIRRDHVIAEMLKGLGAEVREIEAGFSPESGAYSGSHSHDHSQDDGGHKH